MSEYIPYRASMMAPERDVSALRYVENTLSKLKTFGVTTIAVELLKLAANGAGYANVDDFVHSLNSKFYLASESKPSQDQILFTKRTFVRDLSTLLPIKSAHPAHIDSLERIKREVAALGGTGFVTFDRVCMINASRAVGLDSVVIFAKRIENIARVDAVFDHNTSIWTVRNKQTSEPTQEPTTKAIKDEFTGVSRSNSMYGAFS